MTTSEPTPAWQRLVLGLGLGLLGLGLNAIQIEILSGVFLLLGTVTLIAAAVLGGPIAGLVAGAVSGAIASWMFGQPATWLLFAIEGLVIGWAARRWYPLGATLAFWALAALPYFLALEAVYPAGTAVTTVVKAMAESLLSATAVQAVLLQPRLHRVVRGWLPQPLRVVRTQFVVRSVVLLAAVLPLVVLAASDARLLYAQRVHELERRNSSATAVLAEAIEVEIGEAQTALQEAAAMLSDREGLGRRVIAGPLILNALLHEAALVRNGRITELVGIPRSDGLTLRSLEPLAPGPPVREVSASGVTPFLLIAAPVGDIELIGSIDPKEFTALLRVFDPASARILILDAHDRVLADTLPGPIGEGLRTAIVTAGVGGTAAYLSNADVPRTLRPQATTRIALARVRPFDLRVVIARSQGEIQPALEAEALALLGGLGLALVMVVLTSLGLTRSIVEPVRAVSRAASGLEAGHHAARVRGGDGSAPLELRQLAEGFDRMAEELERRLEAIEAASRAKDEFLSVASHELKTPLTILKAQIQLLERRAPEGKQGQLKLIDRQLDRITRLVSQLLDASAVGAGVLALEPRECELSNVVRHVAAGLIASAPDHQLRLDLEPIAGRWDEPRLEQVLHNLIGNAIKYSPGGGPIDVRLRRTEAGGALLEIADRGIGIGPSQQGKLFERFGRGRESGVGGLGVGLYVVREIVERHGGTVALDPREGGGTVATVRLPASVPAGEDRAGPR